MKDLRKWLPTGLAVLLFIALPLAYFSPLLEGKRMVQGDQRNWLGGAQEIIEHREAHDGEEPLWTGSMFSGMPAYQISVVWKGDVLKWVDRLFHGFLPHPAGSVFLYLIGMFILLSLMGVDRGVAVVGALAYAFSSYFIIIFEAGHNTKATAIGYMPLVLGATWALFRGAKLPAAALLALFLGLEVHANHLQVTYYLAMVQLLFALAEALRFVREGRVMDLLGRAGLGLVAVALAVMANAGVLWGTAEYGTHTTRGPSELTIGPDGESAADIRTKGLDRDYVTAWSYGKQESFTFLVPNAKGGDSGSLITTREELAAISDPELKRYLNEVYGGGGYVNSYWGDQSFTSGPVYLGALVVLLLLLMLARTEGPARWWVLAAVPLTAVLIAITSPILAAALVLAYLAAGLVLWRDPLPYALFSGLFLTLLLSWGRNWMPLTDFFLDHVPGYAKFRAVTIILVIVELAAPVLAVLYLDRLVKEGRWDRARERAFLIPAGVLVLVMLVLALMPGSVIDLVSDAERARFSAQAETGDPDRLQLAVDALKEHRAGIVAADAWRGLLFIAAGGALLFLFGRGRVPKMALLGGLGALVLVDLWAVDKRFVNNDKDGGRYRMWEEPTANALPFKPTAADMAILQQEETPASRTDAEATVARLKASKQGNKGRDRMVSKEEEVLARFAALRRNSHFRVLTFNNPFNDSRVSYFHKSVGGYHGAKLKRYQDLIEFHLGPEMAAIGGAFGEGATMSSVNAVLARQNVLNMLNTRYLITDPSRPALLNVNAFGPAWFVNDVRWVKDADAEILALREVGPDTVAVVDERWRSALGDAPLTPDPSASVTLDSYAANALRYTVRSANGGVVVFSEIWYGPDWQATLDGQPVEHVRADHVLRAMRVPAGEHVVEFRVASRSYALGNTLSLAGGLLILLAVAGAGFGWWRQVRFEHA
ncbi:MAG: hypothetical protein JNJ64_06635 [Flavobacteriales bacterium]|nr:hypothetical protein [Flavobacteriales bacterium]